INFGKAACLSLTATESIFSQIQCALIKLLQISLVIKMSYCNCVSEKIIQTQVLLIMIKILLILLSISYEISNWCNAGKIVYYEHDQS
ncbi:MAG: hypothetical protein EBY22_16100, partial [Gammaproteobacteria bacterium]|nr:hypothetical protein [Gammaproteobacteria bacterium]